MIVRRAWRACSLVATLVVCVLRYWLIRLRGPLSFAQRAKWLQDSCRIVLRRMGIRLQVVGPDSAEGIVVSNHLSYLDIASLGAAVRGCLVSKAEIRRWPLIGTIARSGGTIFLDRSSLTSAERVAGKIAERIGQHVSVIVFPEGTTSDGSSVMRFHSLLLEPAIRAGLPITACAVRYLPPCGHEESELCWYGDDGFLQHIWRVLGIGEITAEIRIGPPRIYPDRRTAAAQTHAEVTALRMGGLKESVRDSPSRACDNGCC